MSANQLIHAMLSHRGLVRRGNEDACATCEETGAFVVCDGMGGAAAGEVASHLAAETFLSHLRLPTGNGNGNGNGSHAVSPQERLCTAVFAANQAVYQHSRQSSKFSGMGTTLVALLAPVADIAASIWLAHVGDSRCYRLRYGHLQQLTHDHSLVEEQLRAGQITPAQAAISPMRNLITRAIGSRPGIEPEIQRHHLQPRDLYLLASDGLTHDVSDIEIESILAAIPSPVTRAALNQACEVLIAAANHNGGHDNTTVLLIAVP
ncbi:MULTISPECIES: PP2C family serine/threonine-protein phosphatase [Acidobacteriaceae]|uniref:PP2C family protein-serine/threonine phosphatase n=1 Tax=Acidobacteriaceae TaxID=204434 RepID=UPI00131C7A5C|nr:MULTISPECIES: PP2C family serine/threonine-protein phosphatase [Acidobacteriaceae]MDW5264901.1 PP2C family serine/threonine-protein phosphatase [Edaphobacter sp.]